jgi:two-component system response regulator PilR (NtrC family)
MSKAVTKISEEAMMRLVHYSWPGNVRELENVIERAVALETSPAVLAERLPEALLAPATTAAGSSAEVLALGFSLDRHLQSIEAELLRRALDQAQGNRATAAQLLGVTPRSLRYLIRKHGSPAQG